MQEKTNEYWKTKLSPEVYHITREKGTEAPYTGIYLDNHRHGVYRCAACGSELFPSGTKFDSGSGWPSFTAAIDPDKVVLSPDDSHGMHRTEAKCANCGAHLGHVFDDGPVDQGGARYCINSLALDFTDKPQGQES